MLSSVLRAAFGYCFLILMVRVVGRRPGTQMTPFDFVFVFFVGGLTLTPMVGNDRSISNALIIITSIAVTHFVITWTKQRYPVIGRIIDGTPLVLYENGRWVDETLRRNLIPRDDVLGAVRGHGLRRIEDVEYAVLERNGEITIFERRGR